MTSICHHKCTCFCCYTRVSHFWADTNFLESCLDINSTRSRKTNKKTKQINDLTFTRSDKNYHMVFYFSIYRCLVLIHRQHLFTAPTINSNSALSTLSCFAAVNHLSGPLGKQKFTLMGSQGCHWSTFLVPFFKVSWLLS